MTPQAVTLQNRRMHQPLALIFRSITVTGITQILHLLLKKASKSSDMWIMASQAFTFTSRNVTHSFLESILIMARETIDSGLCKVT